MGSTQKDLETGSPLSWVGQQVLQFFIASGRSVFSCKDFGANKCFLGRRQGISPYLKAIFGEHVNFCSSFFNITRQIKE
jgi:hypothetical protein